MRFLITGDTHFGKTINNKNFDITFNAFSRLIAQAIEHKIDYLIIAGDIYNRSKPKMNVIHRANKLFEIILENDIGLILLPGNHDKGKLQYPLNYYFFRNSERYHIINSIKILNFDGYQLMFIPYSKNWPKEKINSQKIPTIIICHQTFDGAVFGPQNYVFTEKYDGAIMMKNYNDNIKSVISGHIHKAQKLKHDIPIYYTGSLEPLSFSEIYDKKGYIIMEDLNIDFHTIQPISKLQVIEVDGEKLSINDINKQILKKIKDNNNTILIRIINRDISLEDYNFIKKNIPIDIKIIPNNNRYLRKLY